MECIHLQDWVVIDYLKSRSKLNSKDQELLIALFLNKFHERQWGCKCCIGLEIMNKFSKDFPKQGYATLKQLEEIISSKVEEYNPVDIFIAKENEEIGNDGFRKVRKGNAFQIKRFGKDKGNKTNDLLNLLNNKYKKYTKTKTTLIILFETSEEMDLWHLQKSLNADNYPFERIMFLSMGDGKIRFGELWPKSGMEEYDAQTFLFS